MAIGSPVRKSSEELHELGKLENLKRKISLCEKQNKQVVKSHIVELDEALMNNENDEVVKFVGNESKAIELLQAFDIGKLSAGEELKAWLSYKNSCSDKNHNLDIPSCKSYFDELHFFQGLVYASKSNAWKRSTQKMIREKILNYIDYGLDLSMDLDLGVNSFLFMNFQLLKLLVDYGLIDSKFKENIYYLSLEFEKENSYFYRESSPNPKNDCRKLKKISMAFKKIFNLYTIKQINIMKDIRQHEVF